MKNKESKAGTLLAKQNAPATTYRCVPAHRSMRRSDVVTVIV